MNYLLAMCPRVFALPPLPALREAKKVPALGEWPEARLSVELSLPLPRPEFIRFAAAFKVTFLSICGPRLIIKCSLYEFSLFQILQVWCTWVL